MTRQLGPAQVTPGGSTVRTWPPTKRSRQHSRATIRRTLRAGLDREWDYLCPIHVRVALTGDLAVLRDAIMAAGADVSGDSFLNTEAFIVKLCRYRALIQKYRHAVLTAPIEKVPDDP